MDTKIYVGNLLYEATSKDLIELFSPYGHVVEAMVVQDKFRPGFSKGFGFVTLSTSDEVQNALQLNGTEYKGRKLLVQPAKADDKRETSQQ